MCKPLHISVSIVVLLQLLCAVNSANILFFDAFGTHSIRISKWPLMEALSEKGHTITYLSPFKNFEVDSKKSKIITYEPTKLAESFVAFEEDFGNFYQIRKNNEWNTVTFVLNMFRVGVSACENLYSDKEFMKWMKSSKFDLVVAETNLNECAFGMVDFWKAKLAIYSTYFNPSWITDAHGFPDETSTIADLMTYFQREEGMTFIERFVNAMVPVGHNILREWLYFPQLEEVTRKGLGKDAKDMPPFREVEKNATIIFMAQHYSMEFPRAYPPNVIPVGGNVVSKKLKPLPKEIETFINSAKNGFIYVSFGTVGDFTKFDKEVQIEFIKALGQFPEIKFVWKSHNQITAAKIPENVLVTKWLPQQTLLAHPKIKAMIMHGGMGSSAEVIHYSIPSIIFPIGGDQDGNAFGIARKGAGIKMEIVDMKQHQLEDAIKEILYNKKYREGMTRLTKIFMDRPIPTLDEAVWWTEYVLRHDNVQEFLVHPSIHQPWWKRRQIDVWVTAAMLLLISILMPLYFLYFVTKQIFRTKQGEKTTQKVKLS